MYKSSIKWYICYIYFRKNYKEIPNSRIVKLMDYGNIMNGLESEDEKKYLEYLIKKYSFELKKNDKKSE